MVHGQSETGKGSDKGTAVSGAGQETLKTYKARKKKSEALETEMHLNSPGRTSRSTCEKLQE